MNSETDFHALLDAARNGSERAWASIYRELAPSVLGYLRARGASEPEDLTGEVFVQVVRGLPSFEGGERDFRAWALTIAHRRLVDEIRRRRRRPVDPVPEEVLSDAGPIGDAEEEALQRVGAARVTRLFGSVSPDQQSVLLLRILGDLSVDEVARAVGKRPGAVKALQRRGLARIKKELDRERKSSDGP